MFYDKKAKILTEGKRKSDGMGGWLEPAEPNVLKEIEIASAPISAEIMLKEYGVVSTTSIKLYTESDIPMINFYINFQDQDYRVIQVSKYENTRILLLELM